MANTWASRWERRPTSFPLQGPAQLSRMGSGGGRGEAGRVNTNSSSFCVLVFLCLFPPTAKQDIRHGYCCIRCRRCCCTELRDSPVLGSVSDALQRDQGRKHECPGVRRRCCCTMQASEGRAGGFHLGEPAEASNTSISRAPPTRASESHR